jgi:exopolyphosphatase/guanosine-5'-triphosphate,3'-diphosphate pyrophosphatase
VKVAAVDIGTNTVRLLLADAVVANGTVELNDVARYEVITKLGEGLDGSGRLGEAPMERALAGLAHYAGLISDAGVASAGGVATAATRNAVNGPEFAVRIADVLGFAPKVIDGVEEAKLTFHGATEHLAGDDVYCVIDVGGGSTEFVTGHSDPEYVVSVDVGSVLLTDRIEKLGLVDTDAIRRYVDGLFADVSPPVAPGVVLGSGGTFITLAAVARDISSDEDEIAGLSMTMEEVGTTVDFIAALTPEQLAALPGVKPDRAPVLRAGVICAERAVARVGAALVRVSVSDILDGVAIELGVGRWPAWPSPDTTV